MVSLKDNLKGLMNYISRLTASQVMMLFGVSIGTVVGLFFVVGWLTAVGYAPLYSNLDESEAGEIVTYLDDNQIPYNLTDLGKTIEIPSSDIYKTRISLAAEGLPHSGTVGYDIFDNSNFGMTDFQQNLNYKRALEGELTRTIMELDEIVSARVHIVLPKERLFKKDGQQATASVVLKLRNSGTLSRPQINAISNLIAASVEGLKPNKISIVDYRGNLLSSPHEENQLAGLSSTQLDMRQQVEKYLEHKAQSMLNDVLGYQKAVLRVTADLNYNKIEITNETFDADNPALRSEEQLPGNNTITSNYELNRKVEHIVNGVGSIERLSVAVMVDGHYQQKTKANGGIEKIYQPRSEQELEQLASIVKNSIGFDAARNDQIEMINFPFDRNETEVNQSQINSTYNQTNNQSLYLDIAKKIGLFLLALILFFYFKKLVGKLFASLPKMNETPRENQSVNSSPSNSYNQYRSREYSDEPREQRLVEKMQQTAKNKPDEITRVIKTLMAD